MQLPFQPDNLSYIDPEPAGPSELQGSSFLKYASKTHAQRSSAMTIIRYGRPASSLSSPTIVLVIINILVFVVLTIGGQDFYVLLAQVGDLFFQQHYYWQLFTSLFVHFDILHILFNMYGLFYFGRLNEAHFSLPRYLAIYFGSGLLGNVASLYLVPPDVQSGGASGAIFGLVGSYVTIEKRAQHMGMALLYAVLIFVQSSGPGVNIFAHLFGLLGGFVLGLLFSPRRQPTAYSISYTLTS
jgi:rhomboid protease GluP